jgi:hypothetical protein
VIGQSSLQRSVLSSVALGIENEHAVQTPTNSIPLTKDSDGDLQIVRSSTKVQSDCSVLFKATADQILHTP